MKDAFGVWYNSGRSMARKKSSEEIHAGETKFVAICDLTKSLTVAAVIAFLGYHVVVMMTKALSANPETLTAFAKCLAEWKLSQVVFAIASAIFGCGWFIEHRRNNRLVKRNGEIRHEKESSDTISTRSGLDSFGRTPKGE